MQAHTQALAGRRAYSSSSHSGSTIGAIIQFHADKAATGKAGSAPLPHVFAPIAHANQVPVAAAVATAASKQPPTAPAPVRFVSVWIQTRLGIISCINPILTAPFQISVFFLLAPVVIRGDDGTCR
jgi:hypothetical protein